MIAKAEYLGYAASLLEMGQGKETQTRALLLSAQSITEAVKVGQDMLVDYHAGFEDLLSTSLADTGVTAVDHYDKQLNLHLTGAEKNEIVAEAIQKQVHIPFYGQTLDERLQYSRMTAQTRLYRSSVVGAKLDTRKENIARMFVQPYPYGAAVTHDTRILLSQSVQLEHDIAKAMAEEANVTIVKWTLSHQHKKRDICDDYAEVVDKAVKTYLRNREIRVDPKGCYFLNEVPLPPHPNCQCSLSMLHNGSFTSTVVRRALEKLVELLGKFRKRR